MKFSAALALCAAPLALAGSLQVDLMKRGAVGVEVSSGGSSGSQKSSSSSNKDSSGGSSQSSTSITEVIILWVNNGGNSQTSTVNAVGSSSGTAAAATHSVTVGGSAGLVYTPNTLNAAVGDEVIFTFLSANHTATQSAFTTPCEKLEGGMDSGFMPNANNTINPPPQMAVKVSVATPIWFYCKQKGHCGKGMTFSINPTANKTQAMFEQMAIAQNGTGTASGITGSSSAAAPPPPAASAASAAAPPPPAGSSSSSSSGSSSSGSMVSGSGTLNAGGACECACLCGVAAFPSAAQGVGGFGGMTGAMPLSALPA